MFPLKYALSYVITACSIALLPAAWAQNREDSYPSRSVTIVVPAPGTISEAHARFWSKPLSELLGKPFIVDFKPGASGIIGANTVARAAPDGHTLLVITGTYTTLAAFNQSLPFDIVKSFAPVSQLGSGGYMLVVTPSLPVHTFAEYLAYARAHPSELNWGTSGAGSSFHLVGAWLGSETGTKVTFVHYKGNSANFADLARGRVHVSPMTIFSGLPRIKSGQVRPIAQLGIQRSSYLPDLPTVAEQGVPGFDASSWQGLLATGGTPADIVAKLHRAIALHAKSPEALSWAKKQGIELVAGSPKELGQKLQEEVARWERIVRENKDQPR